MQATSIKEKKIIFSAKNISKTFHVKENSILALENLSLDIEEGKITALVGPDGAGKSTLLRIIAGLIKQSSGSLFLEDENYDEILHILYNSISYMPQKFGLYEDLTVEENLELYADLKNLSPDLREERFTELLNMCAMLPFKKRLAGKLSGGMKQKLGLICTLLVPPKLLLLDEPTVGVDPLSRRELWEIIIKQTQSAQMSLIVSTSYLDEAKKCDAMLMLFEGKTLAYGKPEEITQQANNMSYLSKLPKQVNARKIQAQLHEIPDIIDALPRGEYVRFVHDALSQESKEALDKLLKNIDIQKVAPDLEDAFMLLLKKYHKTKDNIDANFSHSLSYEKSDNIEDYSSHDFEKLEHKEGEAIIETKNVSKFFNDFKAVDDVSFSVYKGEVFGLLGPNGAGKTTTFRMLCGLMPASLGSLYVAGIDVKKMRTEARRHIGYVAQKFSLYGTLSTKENLNFFAGAYGLLGKYKNKRIKAVIEEFSLGQYLNYPTQNLPGGYKQRLAMAVGLLHEPSILFLDEATSGADPIARREFWQRISKLSDEGVTIIITTHFMEEAEYCDRVIIQDHGRMLALGTPQSIRMQSLQNNHEDFSSSSILLQASEITMEDAFINIVERSRNKENTEKRYAN